ncbi:MAG: hypothetical protein JWR50_1751 [Mucilaginibacter sp.]|nr:hypothetical protein [Mucilaginibacter sp.]
MPKPANNKTTTLLTILWLSLLTGTLDGAAAILLNLSLGPETIFRYIASGIFGRAAFEGGPEMVVSGVIFHYLIAILFTTVFYRLYPMFNTVFKNKYIVAIVFGALAWVVMNIIVVPLSKIGSHPIKIEDVLTGLFALILCLGLPVATVADKRNK